MGQFEFCIECKKFKRTYPHGVFRPTNLCHSKYAFNKNNFVLLHFCKCRFSMSYVCNTETTEVSMASR